MSARVTWSVGWSLVLAFLAPAARGDDPPKSADPAPVQLTAEQDHKRLMDLLKIDSLRQGANGNDPKDLGTSDMPAVETGLIDGEVAFRQHAGGHTTGPNWPTFLKYADRYIKVAAEK